jgi:hypothetical protein
MIAGSEHARTRCTPNPDSRRDPAVDCRCANPLRPRAGWRHGGPAIRAADLQLVHRGGMLSTIHTMDDRSVAHMEERLSRGRGWWPSSGWLCGGCGCGWRGGRGVRGVRDVWSCSYSGAGPRPLFVARPLSKVERAHPGWGAQATNRGVVCASRDASDRLANRNGLSVSVSRCQSA